MSSMMRGHELRGQAPPYLINITARTQFFKAPALAVTEALITKAEELLDSPSPANTTEDEPNVWRAYYSGRGGSALFCSEEGFRRQTTGAYTNAPAKAGWAYHDCLLVEGGIN
ncbi:uncharacterized protein LOC143412675 [Maylandia zebra]|uniref:uncharacterized protein LOC143412675 n=1 Tax=Maylandia zebra TaxID=106582 RepID=UPI00403D5515